MQITSFDSPHAFTELATEWNEVLVRSATNTPFGSWQWHQHWWEAYHPGDLWVLMFREGPQLVGIAALFVETTDEGRALRFVGSEDVTDYLDLIVDRDHQGVVYDAFVQTVLDHPDRYDFVDFCNIPAGSPTLDALQQRFEASDYIVEQARQDVCPLIRLPQSFDDYAESLEKRQRKDLSRKMRMAGVEENGVDWYIVGEDHDLQEQINIFVALMRSSHPEKAEFLENEQHLAFFNGIIPAAMEAGWLQLNFLTINGEPAAAYFNFDYNGQIYVYNSGLDPQKATQLSPGILLLAFNIQHAIEHERTIFNFLRGDEDYKYRMGGQDTEVIRLTARRA